MEKPKKRFPRPTSFIMKRRSESSVNSKSGSVNKKSSNDCKENCAAVGSQLLEERNDAFEQCKRLKTELETSNDKVDQYETEVELLRSQLRSLYRKELKVTNNVSSCNNTDSEDGDVVVSKSTTRLQSDIRPDIKACSDGESDAEEHHTRPCKECEKLLLTRVSAVVEAITLRRYVIQMNKMTGQNGTVQSFLSDNERKLTKTLAEKELLTRQLKTVIRERDKVLVERDRALEEWEKAASKWETTLDQLDTLMIQQNEAKERDSKTIARLKDVIAKHEEKLKAKDDGSKQLNEQMVEMEKQLTTSKKETKDCLNEHDVVLKANYNIAQELRRVSGELKECQMKCSELNNSLQKAETLLERNKINGEHIVKQWKQAVKEKKKLQRDTAEVVSSRDEAVQRNLSTLAQLDRVREERDRLTKRVNTAEGTGSDISSYSHYTDYGGVDCQFCSQIASTDEKAKFDEVNVFIPNAALSQGHVSLGAVLISGHLRVVVTKVDDYLLKHHNLRKYDDIVAVNQELVLDGDVDKVNQLIHGGQADLNLTVRRYITPFVITFEGEISIPKKSKLGCGIHWGVYIRHLSFDGEAKASGKLEIGDYVNTINDKNLSKIMSHALDKYSKRGDKMSVQVSRKVSPAPKCSCRCGSTKSFNMRSRDKYFNRDSVISIESNQSLGASSISSIPSYISSIDSISVCSRTESESHFKADRKAPDVFTIESGVPPTIAEESSTDDGVFHKRSRRVRSLNHLGKSKYQNLPRTQSLHNSLDSEKSTLSKSRPRSSGAFYGSSGSIVSVKRAHSLSPTPQSALFTVPVSRERTRVIRLDKRSGERLGLTVNGGNRVGIYVTGFHKQSLAEEAGVRIGDRLLQLNSFTLTHATLDYATRIIQMMGTCNYIRMEVQNYSNTEEVLKQSALDSLYIRARLPCHGKLATEISFNIGEKLRVVNTRADYDPAKQTWRWLAVRDRAGENGEKVEGFIPPMNQSPAEADERTSNAAKSGSTVTVRQSESEDGVLSDDSSIPNGYHRTRRNSIESLNKIRRYRGSKRRSSIESIGSDSDCYSEHKRTNYYEVLEEKQV